MSKKAVGALAFAMIAASFLWSCTTSSKSSPTATPATAGSPTPTVCQVCTGGYYGQTCYTCTPIPTDTPVPAATSTGTFTWSSTATVPATPTYAGTPTSTATVSTTSTPSGTFTSSGTPTSTPTCQPTVTCATALFSPTAAGTAAVVINEVFAVGSGSGFDFIELKNVGGSSVSLSGYYLCHYPNYWPIPAVTLSAGALVVVHWDQTGTNTATDLYTGTEPALSQSGDDIGFYSSANFGMSSAIVDYVEWGTGNPNGQSGGNSHREPVAVGAGIWSTGDRAVPMSGGESLNLIAGSPGNLGCSYHLCPPSPGS